MKLFSSAGRNGVSITLVTQYDIHLVHSIEEQIRKSLGCKDRVWFTGKSSFLQVFVFNPLKSKHRNETSAFCSRIRGGQ